MNYILLNGQKHELAPSFTILGLIEHLGIAHKAIAVLINSQVVKKHLWDNHVLQNGDEVEILDFVGGG